MDDSQEALATVGQQSSLVPTVQAGALTSDQTPPRRHQFRPSGRRKAVLVGINYEESPRWALRGCIRDVEYLHYLLSTKYSFKDFLILADGHVDIPESAHVQVQYPSRNNIFRAVAQLVQCAQPGDSLFFSFSGHGIQVPDINGDEPDGLDEALVPADFQTHGYLLDDDLGALVQKVCKGARLTSLIDACHSGSVMDLPFEIAAHPHVHPPPSYMDGSPMLAHLDLSGEVLLIASCHDHELASEEGRRIGNVPCGAVVLAFVEVVEEAINVGCKEFSFFDLLAKMRANLLRNGHLQKPVLSSTLPLRDHLQTLFLL